MKLTGQNHPSSWTLEYLVSCFVNFIHKILTTSCDIYSGFSEISAAFTDDLDSYDTNPNYVSHGILQAY